MPVTQANSLTTVYQPHLPSTPQLEGTQKASAGSGLGGKEVRQDEGGTARAYAPKTQWQRFTSRLKHSFNTSRFSSAGTDAGASQRAVRFNARHQGFSGKVENLVARLAQGLKGDVQDKNVLATLRNDVKLMHRDAPWAARTDILATRMDIELSKLDDEQLKTVAKQLKDADRTGLTEKDKADLRTMQRAVIRQTASRSPEMRAVLAEINLAAPGDISKKGELLKKLDVLTKGIDSQVKDLGLTSINSGRNEDILSGAITMAVKKSGRSAEELSALNRNLLNLERDVVKNAPKGLRPYIAVLSPELRVLSRAVRQEFLATRSGVFQDTQLRSRLTVLGAGAAHEVSKGTYHVSGKDEARVHKYDDEEVGSSGHRFTAPTEIGLDPTEPRLLERSVFTSKLNDVLGFKVCVGTDFARHHDRDGIVMELASGKVAGDTRGVGGNPATAQREMTKLQLLDIITGQTDRHRGNYMVEKNSTGEIVGIKAIDSDFAMGPKKGILGSLLGRNGIHMAGMPVVVDHDMAKAVLDLKHSDLERLGGGMFDDETMAAAKERLDALKSHIQQLGKDGWVIDPKDWGSEAVTERMTKEKVEVKVQNDQNVETTVQVPTSYWQRDYSKFLQPEETDLGFSEFGL